MRSDPAIRKDVIAELAWEPRVNSGGIDVDVNDGMVTLSGIMDSYSKKMYAEMAASGVQGVTGLNNNIQVELPQHAYRSDTDIEEAIARAYRWSNTIPDQDIRIDVKDGHVELFGSVEWEFQKHRAKRIAEDIIGVKDVTNSINIKSTLPTTSDVKEKISAALKRSIDFDDNRIYVEVHGHIVMLTGKVSTVSEKNRAERAAWSAPGVKEVENKIQVSFTKPYFE